MTLNASWVARSRSGDIMLRARTRPPVRSGALQRAKRWWAGMVIGQTIGETVRARIVGQDARRVPYRVGGRMTDTTAWLDATCVRR